MFTKALTELGQSIEDDRRALEAEGAVKIRKIEVDFENFEVSTRSCCIFLRLFVLLGCACNILVLRCPIARGNRLREEVAQI